MFVQYLLVSKYNTNAGFGTACVKGPIRLMVSGDHRLMVISPDDSVTASEGKLLGDLYCWVSLYN